MQNKVLQPFEKDYIINVYVNAFILMFYVSDSFADLGN